jgi:ABC-type iron transport system FetAB permease component
MNSASVPPRFVPTLTDVVQPVDCFSLKPSEGPVRQNAVQLEDQIVHRVMQRVDLVLERRLREAIAQVILSHTQALGQRLREEIELVVRESVSQAVAQELPPESE